MFLSGMFTIPGIILCCRGMKLKAAGKSHKGMKRRNNEDNYLISPDLGIYLVADGMGGHRAGEVASRMVVDTVENYWRKTRVDRPSDSFEPAEKSISIRAGHLINSISLANAAVHEAQKRPEFHRMGSTISALLIDDDRIWSANVGDSPVYVFSRGRLSLVSQEHSVQAEQRDLGIYDPLGSTNPLMKNMLTRVLGLNEKVDVYIVPLSLEPNDLILMCSDGLTNFLPDDAITAVLNDFSLPLERKVDIFIEEANLRGGGDNITVILLEVQDEGIWDRLKKKVIMRSQSMSVGVSC